MKKQRTDSIKGGEIAMALALSPLIDPPKHIKLRDRDLPFWQSIVSAKAADKWNIADLETAGNLARCKADIEKIQQEIDREGDVVINQRGTPVMNPRHTILETLSRRSVALSRILHVHAEAVHGKARDQVKHNAAVRQAAGAIDQGDELINRPTIN